MKIVTGADFAGFDLKQVIKPYLEEKGIEVIDVGMHDLDHEIPYYEVAAKAARTIQKGEADKGVLFCGTGMGVSIVANKFKGIYASCVESEFGGQHCKVINNANVITMGCWVFSPYRAKKTVDLWLESSFTEGYEQFADFLKGSIPEIEKIENETMK